MRCVVCRQPAGWFRRQCPPCTRLWQVYETHRGAGMGEFLSLFEATGATRGQIETFLDADPGGAGSMKDRIAADMSNQLLSALGQSPGQTATEVKRLRQRGTWRSFDRPPE